MRLVKKLLFYWFICTVQRIQVVLYTMYVHISAIYVFNVLSESALALSI